MRRRSSPSRGAWRDRQPHRRRTGPALRGQRRAMRLHQRLSGQPGAGTWCAGWSGAGPAERGRAAGDRLDRLGGRHDRDRGGGRFLRRGLVRPDHDRPGTGDGPTDRAQKLQRTRRSLVVATGALRGLAASIAVRSNPERGGIASDSAPGGAAGHDRRSHPALHRTAARAAASAASVAGGRSAGGAADRAGRRGQEHAGHPAGTQAGGGWLDAGGALEQRGQTAERGAAAGKPVARRSWTPGSATLTR
jgi:hypothetical protein